MSTLSIQLPQWLESELRRFAKEDHVTLDAFVAATLGERISARRVADSLRRRASQGDRAKYLAALERVPAVEPDAGDRLDD